MMVGDMKLLSSIEDVIVHCMNFPNQSLDSPNERSKTEVVKLYTR